MFMRADFRENKKNGKIKVANKQCLILHKKQDVYKNSGKNNKLKNVSSKGLNSFEYYISLFVKVMGPKYITEWPIGKMQTISISEKN